MINTNNMIYQTKTGTVCTMMNAPAIAIMKPNSLMNIQRSFKCTTLKYIYVRTDAIVQKIFSFQLVCGRIYRSKGADDLLYKLETQEGSISIDKAVIGNIIAESVQQFNGKVLISNHKGRVSGFVAKIGGIEDVNYMEINMGKNGLDIRFFIVIRFGTSINKVTEQLIYHIKKNVEEFTGLEANSIAVVVTGMISKQVVRRNIEIKG
jgi:Uncharacterized protein conserved in bacteria